ncbi:hypothetical protein NIES4071_29550 [Calothrix sp. NIES-4071]|nr:hypothetical protein NIES4071_29550 [Calothrix sp. NIES-4071]BAZ57275.1 hypothetical protein NIES4105_29490 [Calothrix sp. NIES-4105]
MNYQKLDAALAMAVSEVEDPQEPSLVVFIHTDNLDTQAITFLNRLGIKGVTNNTDIYTATVSSSTVSELSQQPWVKSIKLSQKLRLVKS